MTLKTIPDLLKMYRLIRLASVKKEFGDTLVFLQLEDPCPPPVPGVADFSWLDLILFVIYLCKQCFTGAEPGPCISVCVVRGSFGATAGAECECL